MSLKNTVDDDVKSMLASLDILQYVMFCPKYRIKNNVIAPNSLISNFISMIGTVIYIFAFILCSYMVILNKESLQYTTTVYMSYFYDCVIYCIGFLVNFVSGITQSKNSIQFVLIFQKVHRFFNNDERVRHFIAWNCILIVMALSFYCIGLTCFHIRLDLPFYSVYGTYLLIIFDFNTIYVIRLIKLLENKIILWNNHVLSSQQLLFLHGDKYGAKMFEAYVNILKCYEIHQVCIQPFVSNIH